MGPRLRVPEGGLAGEDCGDQDEVGNGMKKIKVQRSQQQTFTYLADRFCSRCGGKGVYEDGWDEHEQLYCFACDDARPHNIYDPDRTLPRLKARESEVVDRKEWEEEVNELAYQMDQAMAKIASQWLDAMYNYPSPIKFADTLGPHETIPLVYGIGETKKGWAGD